MKGYLQISPDSSQIESKVIDWMRLPLAVLVVFVHVPRQSGNLPKWIWSDAISSMAVPLFFVLSGFLYFYNIAHPEKPQEWYLPKTISRLKSIAIPYLFWALLPTSFFCIRKIVGMLIHWHGPDMLIEGLSQMNFYHIHWESGNGGPEQMQLWFLRNLLIIITFTPLCIFLKQIKYSSLPLLFIASIFNIWIPVPGFSANSTFFFAIGAWCAIHRVSIFQVSKNLFYPSIVRSVIGIILLYFHIIPLIVFNVIAMPMYIYGMWLLFSKESIKPIPTLTNATMFIYLTHGYIVEEPKIWELAHRFLPYNRFGELVGYFTIPLLAIIALIAFHWVLRKSILQTMSFICGR